MKPHKPIYLDYMATTPLDPRVRAKMLPYLDTYFGNPASQHYYGYEAQAAITEARSKVAHLVNCKPENLIWTSGATEANNLAIKGAALFYARQGKHLVTATTEHKSVLDVYKYLETQGFEITYLTPKPDGLIAPEAFAKSLRRDTILTSIMYVNNEIGVIQDITHLAQIARDKGVLLHVDAAQAAGKIPIDLQKLPIDLMSFSAHKIYGPKGVGALYIRSNPRLHLVPQIHGGVHEQGLRAGTLAPHQVVGMGEAYALASDEMITEGKRISALREKLWRGLKKLGGVYINGSTTNRIPGNLNVSFSDINSEQLHNELTNIAVSSTSACNKHSPEPSYVLTALGIRKHLAHSTLRLALGRFTTETDIDIAIQHLTKVINKLRVC